MELLMCVICHNRPQLLDATLKSLKICSSGIDSALWVVDNASDAPTLEVIQNNNVDKALLLKKNVGIGQALEALLPDKPLSPYTLVSESDFLYKANIRVAIDFMEFRACPFVVSFQHSPEHTFSETVEFGSQQFFLKKVERGTSLLFRSEHLWSMKPYPKSMYDFDWWVFRDSPHSVPQVYSIGDGGYHVGQHQSTWYGKCTPEFPDKEQK